MCIRDSDTTALKFISGENASASNGPVSYTHLDVYKRQNKDQVESLDKCLESIEKSSYKNYEIIIVENNSTEDETFAYYKKIESDKIRIVYWSDEFNYSAINNFGVKHARGDYLLLLNLSLIHILSEGDKIRGSILSKELSDQQK